MQNRYCADIGDFGKYGLLKSLCGPKDILGVVWYLVPNEGHNQDGKHDKYLIDNEKNRKRFCNCDPDLWARLQKVREKRHVQAVSTASVLPSGTIFYSPPLEWPENVKAYSELGRSQRKKIRKDWLGQALRIVAPCTIIFVDPDNGIETKTPRYAAKGPKYVFWDEIRSFYNGRDQSIVIYQHVSRKESALHQGHRRLRELQAKLGANGCFALMYRRGTARLFLVVPAKEQEAILMSRAQEMLEGPWCQHFGLITL